MEEEGVDARRTRPGEGKGAWNTAGAVASCRVPCRDDVGREEIWQGVATPGTEEAFNVAASTIRTLCS